MPTAATQSATIEKIPSNNVPKRWGISTASSCVETTHPSRSGRSGSIVEMTRCSAGNVLDGLFPD
jgi:hypothetical protein